MSAGRNPLYVLGFHEAEVSGLRYARLGKTDMVVSQLGFGCGPLGGIYGEFAEEEAIATVREGIRKGVNFLDTAPYYGIGRSETVLGKALEGIPRNAYYLATKVGRYDVDKFDFTADRVSRSVHESLEKLKCGYIDLIQVHDFEFAEDPDIILNETLPALEKLRSDGLVRYIGINGYPLSSIWYILDKNRDSKIDTILTYSRWNFFDKTLDDYADRLKEKGIGIINAAVMAMGLLTKNSYIQDWHPAPAKLKEFCAEIASYCRSEGVDLGRLALAHAISDPDLVTHLVGMQNREILHDNLDVFINGLNDKEKRTLSEVDKRFKNAFPDQRVHWEGVTDVLKAKMYGKKE